MSGRTRLAMALAAVVGLAPAAIGQEKSAEGWIALFNGKDLEGWTPKIAGYEAGENYGDTFRVVGDVLTVSYEDYDEWKDRFGHLFYEHPYSDYRLRVEYRFVGDQCPGGAGWAFRNSGVMFHCQSPDSMGIAQNFPVSIEAQLLGGNGKDTRPTANVCTPGTNIVMDGKLVTQHCNNSSAETYHGDQWVTFELEVHGAGKVRHYVNGELVLEYEQPQLDPNDGDAKELIGDGSDLLLRGGYISLQSESHPVEFRKVELLPLDEDER